MERFRNFLLYLLLGALGLIGGVMLFNYLIMPLFVGHKNTSEIPDVVGMEFSSAESLLRKLEFKVQIADEEYSVHFPAGYIVSQIPSAHSTAKRGRTLRVTLSLGGEMIPVPDLTGFSLRQAEIRLDRHDLKIGDVQYEYSGNILKDNVIYSQPAPGELLPPGSQVNLLVSLGKKSGHLQVPNFIGQPVEAVDEMAEKAGVKAVVSYRKIPAVAPGTIYQQSYAPGSTVPRGTEVKLIANYAD
ncbi:PASTA domain-containing protein [bacterium]|nr:PASTA domain-containing protein [bacterium]